MNRILADTLNLLNGLAAFLIVIGTAGLMAKSWGGADPSIIPYILGAVLGAVIASVFCGLVAYISLIEGHLAAISKSTGEGSASLRFLAKSATFQNAVAEMQIAAHEDSLADRTRRREAA